MSRRRNPLDAIFRDAGISARRGGPIARVRRASGFIGSMKADIEHLRPVADALVHKMTSGTPGLEQQACAAHLFERGRCRWCGHRPNGRKSARAPELGRVRLVATEAVEQRAIIELLVSIGCRYSTQRDQDTDIYVIGTRKPRHLPKIAHRTFQTPGIADLFVFLPALRKYERPTLPPPAVWIEVKALDGVMSPAQLRFEQKCLMRGIAHIKGNVDVVRRFCEHHGYLKAA